MWNQPEPAPLEARQRICHRPGLHRALMHRASLTYSESSGETAYSQAGYARASLHVTRVGVLKLCKTHGIYLELDGLHTPGLIRF